MHYRLSTTIGTAYLLYGAEKAFEMLAEIGYDCIDYGVPCTEYAYGKGLFTLPEREFERFFEKDAALSQKYHLPVGQVHAPFPTWPESNDPAEYEYMQQALEKSLRAAAILGAPYLVLHCAMCAAWGHDTDPARTRAENYKLFARLLPVAQRCGVRIALENMPLERIPTCNPAQLIDYIDMMASDWLVACFDSGHANLSGYDCAEYIRLLGPRLRVLHLHDNDSSRLYRQESEMDQHTCPCLGNIDWRALFAALRQIGYTGTLSLEADSFCRTFSEQLYPLTERFQHDVLQQLAQLYG